MRIGTFTASIIVDGKALEEYDVVSESSTKATCWVPSEEGKPFGVQWKCHEESRTAGVRGAVCVDGIRCGLSYTLPGALGVRDTKTTSSWIHGTLERELMFARIQLCDDDSLLGAEVHKNLGEISLVIERGELVRQCRSDQGSIENSYPGNSERLHERSKKATVHCVGFGPAKTRTRSPHKRRLIHNGQPKITFVFKYQPLNVLQANGIAPRPTYSKEHHIGSPVDRTTEDIKPAELNDLIQGLEDQLKRLRDLQANNSEDRKPKRIKTEGTGERGGLFAPSETIDLT